MNIQTGALLMYRIKNGEPQVLLVHPGGPYWQSKDEGVWSIPKGTAESHETDMLKVAQREFEEETAIKPVGTFVPLGTVERPGKTVHVYAFLGDCDPSKIQSNTTMIEWPPKSGKRIVIPEVDRAAFCTLEEARVKLNGYQVPAINRLEKLIGGGD